MSRYDIYNNNYVDEIEKIRAKYDVPVKYLRVEITESSAVGGIELILSVVDKLHELGYIVEMDDFGSGYSSLNMLKDMPVDVLKIDMKFLSKTSDERKADIIVKNVIRLSDDLDITSLAEGVETEKHFNKLNDFGCTLFQGYYFSKPLPLEEFEAMLKE
jgi:EAL domain-containing protein (putative c-di-GMP-specific phosphodiesterase class I)